MLVHAVCYSEWLGTFLYIRAMPSAVNASAPATPATSRWNTLFNDAWPRDWFVVSGYAFAIFAALGSLTWPLGRDQGMFAWVGEVILRGGLPYRDAWEMKGPLCYYVYAFVIALFGSNDVGIRIFDLAPTLAACWLIFSLVQRLSHANRLGSHCAVIYFLLTYYGCGFPSTAQPDGWAGIIVLAVVVLVTGVKAPSARKMMAAGALLAIAALLKPTFLLFLIIPIVAMVASRTRENALMAVTSLMLGFVIPVGAALFYFDSHAAMHDLIETNRFLAITYSKFAEANPLLRIRDFIAVLPHLALLVPILFAPFGIRQMMRDGYRSESIVVGAWLALTLALVLIQGRFWVYHWLPAVIALSVGSGLAIGAILQRLGPLHNRGGWRLAIGVVAMAALLLPSAGRAVYRSYEWPIYVAGRETRQLYLEHVSMLAHGWNSSTFLAIADYIRGHSQPEDRVLCWGIDPVINFYAGRLAPSRFGYSYPIAVPGAMREGYRKIFLNEITDTPPRYIVIDARQSWELIDEPGLVLLQAFPQFAAFIRDGYVQETMFGDYQVWGRTSTNDGPKDR
jgi:hypothetical protein